MASDDVSYALQLVRRGVAFFVRRDLACGFSAISKTRESEIAAMEIADIPDDIYVARAFKLDDGDYDWFIGTINRKARPAKGHFWVVYEDRKELRNPHFPKKVLEEFQFTGIRLAHALHKEPYPGKKFKCLKGSKAQAYSASETEQEAYFCSFC